MERGAVEGEVFHRGAVRELTHSDDVEPQLVGLVRKELIHPTTATLAGDHAFRFRHLLIRDAAYDALPKETRAKLHAQFAAWLAAHGRELIELDEVVGYHLEQAAGYKRELGHRDEELERAAGRLLAEAGIRAAFRSDTHGAANLLGRAVALLPESDPARASALVNRIALLAQAGDPGRDEAIAQLETSSDPRLREHGRLARLHMRLMTEPAAVMEEAEQAANDAIALFSASGDDLGLAQAYYLLSWTSWMRSMAVPAAAALERLIEHAGRAGVRVMAEQSEIQRMGALTHGPFTPAEITPHLERLREAGTPVTRANVLMIESELAVRGGHFTDAVTAIEAAGESHRELGLTIGTTLCAAQRAEHLAAAGRLEESAAGFRDTIAVLESLDQTAFLSTVTIELGEVLYRLGEAAEAERLAIEGEEMGAVEDVVNFAWGRGLRARIAADRGDREDAERLARDAVRYAHETDFPRVQAAAHGALAHAHRAAGRLDEARAELEREAELWKRYGFQVDAARVRALLAEL